MYPSLYGTHIVDILLRYRIKDLSSVESLILVGCRGPLGSCLLPPKIPPLGEPETKWYRTPLFMLLQSRATKSEHRRRVTPYQMNNQSMTKFVTSVSSDPWFNRSTVVSIWEVSSIESVAKLMNNCVSQLEVCAFVGRDRVDLLRSAAFRDVSKV